MPWYVDSGEPILKVTNPACTCEGMVKPPASVAVMLMTAGPSCRPPSLALAGLPVKSTIAPVATTAVAIWSVREPLMRMDNLPSPDRLRRGLDLYLVDGRGTALGECDPW